MNIFDIIGPIMIGPSSSHTAGACRLGKVARRILNEEVETANIILSGSFAKTYFGHGTDKAIIAGLMGFNTYDEDIKNALNIAKEKNIKYEFRLEEIPNTHPNTAKIEISGKTNSVTIIGSSIGGGNIIITKLNDMEVHFTGNNNTIMIIHKDLPGVIAEVTTFIAEKKLNICGFRLSRENKGGNALMTIEIEGEVENDIIDKIKTFENVINLILIRAI